jgi:hypothetical protein
MQVKSKFRKLFWVRIGIGFIVFLVILYLCLIFILRGFQVLKNPLLIAAFIFLSFLIYAALDLFKIFKITVTDKGIEKNMLISGRKEYIPFAVIIGVKKEKIRLRTKSGDLTDGYTVSILKLENNKSLVISPDNFENYKDIMLAIKSNLE